MDKQALYLQRLFKEANEELLTKDYLLFEKEVSERTICGALSQHLNRLLYRTQFSSYFVDVEYNRNKNKKIKTCYLPGSGGGVVNINCDLIIHSRGTNREQDNLIAIEMKKHTRRITEKNMDRRRIMSLTSDGYSNVGAYDIHALPEHVCRYKLGIYYEINFKRKNIKLEYYYKGKIVEEKNICYEQYLSNHN